MINSVRKRSVNILFYAIVVAIVFMLGHISAVFVYGYNASGRTLNINSLNNSNSPLKPEDMALYWEVYGLLEDNYIDGKLPDKQQLIESSTKGLVAGLEDRYTNYYTKKEWGDIQKGNSGKFQGIGIKLMPGEGYVQVEAPIKGTPAARAGIMAGDLILEVDGKSMENVAIGAVAEKIRGEKGSKVGLKIFRPDSGETLDFKVERADIDIDSIEYKALGDGGYMISISKFTESSYSEFQDQWLRSVDSISKQNPKYVVLDLRNNGGGWVDAAKFVLGEFVPEDTTVLKEVDKDGNEDLIKTDREGKLTKVPMVILVNSGTASASEIVSGALQDLGRAKLVGEATLGKGVEQRILDVSDGGSLHVVFKRWFTPKGHNLSKENALKPDKEVKLTTKDYQAGKDPQLDAAKDMLN